MLCVYMYAHVGGGHAYICVVYVYLRNGMHLCVWGVHACTYICVVCVCMFMCI